MRVQCIKRLPGKRILLALLPGCLVFFLLTVSMHKETQHKQFLELLGYWLPEDTAENHHSFFPDDSAQYVPWHTDDGGRLSGVHFFENGEVCVSIRYEKNGFPDNEWVLRGSFTREQERLLLYLYQGIDKAVYCRYFIRYVNDDRLILQKAYFEDGVWLPIYVSDYLRRNGK